MNTTELLKLETRGFDFLNGVIQEYGLYIFIGFVFLLIPFLAWVLTGGLQRKLAKGKPVPQVRPTIVVQIPVGSPRRRSRYGPGAAEKEST
jgi:hypothetical protein